MKQIFRKPIGTIRGLGIAWKWRLRWRVACLELGTLREWITDALCLLICVAVVILVLMAL